MCHPAVAGDFYGTKSTLISDHQGCGQLLTFSKETARFIDKFQRGYAERWYYKDYQFKHHLWDPCPTSLSLRRGGWVCELKRFRSIGRAGERIFAQGSDVKEADIHFTNSRLVWLPFMEKGIYLRESHTDFALQKNALELN